MNNSYIDEITLLKYKIDLFVCTFNYFVAEV